MGDLGRWEVLLFAVAGYVAVTSLMKLMANRRDQLVAQVQQQVDAERERRQRAAELAKKKKQDAA